MKTIPVSGLWLRRCGDYVDMLAEVDGQWLVVATEHVDAAFSHIVEPEGIRTSPPSYEMKLDDEERKMMAIHRD